MDNNNRTTNTNDQIEIGEIFRTLGDGLLKVGNYFLYVLASLRNTVRDNKTIFITLIILGLGTGALYHFLRPDTYRSTMIINCTYLSNQFILNTVENLNLLAEEETPDGLAEQLQITPELAAKIQEFEMEAFITDEDKVDTELLKERLNNLAIDEDKEVIANLIEQLRFENRNTFQISISVLDPDIIKILEEALVKYFKNNPFIKRRMEINMINLSNRKQKLLQESRKIDSLKTVIFQYMQAITKTNRGSNNVFLGDERMTNPLDVVARDLALHEDILSIERELYVNPDFEVVEGFVTSKQPANFGLVATLAIAFVLSVLLGYVVVGLMKINRVLDRFPTR